MCMECQRDVYEMSHEMCSSKSPGSNDHLQRVVFIIKNYSFRVLVTSRLFTPIIPGIYHTTHRMQKSKTFAIKERWNDSLSKCPFCDFFFKLALSHSEKMLSFQKVCWMIPCNNLHKVMHRIHVEAGFHNSFSSIFSHSFSDMWTGHASYPGYASANQDWWGPHFHSE